MLSMEMDAPNVTLATPEEFKDASQKMVNIWVGAMSPLWAPFWAATAFGVGVWAWGQGFKNSIAAGELIDKDAPLAARWPGFALPFATPWSHGYGEVIEKVDALTDIAQEALSTPVQLAFETEEKLEAAADEAVEAAKTIIGEPAFAPLATAETAIDKALEPVHAVTQAAQEATAAAIEEAAQAVQSSANTTLPLIDPVSEAPVVPAIAEATAEKVPMPAARRPRKR